MGEERYCVFDGGRCIQREQGSAIVEMESVWVEKVVAEARTVAQRAQAEVLMKSKIINNKSFARRR